MTRALPALALALALAACNPVAYVPSLIPAAPPTAGVRVGAGGNLFGAHGTVDVSAAPTGGAAVFARGLYGNDGNAEPLTQRGGDVGVVLARPLSRRVTVDLSASRGRAVVVDPSSHDSYGARGGETRTRVRQTTVHAGLMLGDNPPGEDSFRIGPAVRLTGVVAVEDVEGGRNGAGLFVEPAVRATFGGKRLEVQTQGGLSLLARGDLFEDYTSIPFFGGVTVALRLGR